MVANEIHPETAVSRQAYLVCISEFASSIKGIFSIDLSIMIRLATISTSIKHGAMEVTFLNISITMSCLLTDFSLFLPHLRAKQQCLPNRKYTEESFSVPSFASPIRFVLWQDWVCSITILYAITLSVAPNQFGCELKMTFKKHCLCHSIVHAASCFVLYITRVARLFLQYGHTLHLKSGLRCLY